MSAERTSCSLSQLIRDRAYRLRQIRQYLDGAGLFEVDVPALVSVPPNDDHIDLFEVAVGKGLRYLHSSPEYGMKRLLAEGAPDIYQISHVYRAAEIGPLHNPEFLMLEWYRKGWQLETLITETAAVMRLLLGPLELKVSRYWNLLEQAVGFDIYGWHKSDLLRLMTDHGIALSSELYSATHTDLIQLLFTHLVEPHLGATAIEVVRDYPDDQAALAQIVEIGDRPVAQRFEAYYNGVELCNGYQELADVAELRQRFLKSNRLRIERGLAPYAIDEEFIVQVSKIGPYAGVALGLDRLLMLSMNRYPLAAALPICWQES